jgi:hypothetical protein
MVFPKIPFILILVALGCSHEDEFNPVYDVPEEFQPVVETFIFEASHRGIEIEMNNLIIQYDNKLEEPFCGQCNDASKGKPVQKIISINPDNICWQNDLELETLIFHELGHCVLGRLHSAEVLPNGDPKSIMVKDNISLYSPCIYAIDEEECNKLIRRNYYLDELFLENAPVPDWAQ